MITRIDRKAVCFYYSVKTLETMISRPDISHVCRILYLCCSSQLKWGWISSPLSWFPVPRWNKLPQWYQFPFQSVSGFHQSTGVSVSATDMFNWWPVHNGQLAGEKLFHDNRLSSLKYSPYQSLVAEEKRELRLGWTLIKIWIGREWIIIGSLASPRDPLLSITVINFRWNIQ